MRISDWSSDVCSSDLPSLTRSIEGAEDDAEAARGQVDRAAIGPDDVLLGIAASGTTAYTIAAVERARERGALTIGIANNEGAPILAAPERRTLLDTGSEVIAGRSEEHTSELQSLMRISYAVFCLKKKRISLRS